MKESAVQWHSGKSGARLFSLIQATIIHVFLRNQFISSHWLSLERFVSLLNLSFTMCALRLSFFRSVYLYKCVSLILSVRRRYISIEFLLSYSSPLILSLSLLVIMAIRSDRHRNYGTLILFSYDLFSHFSFCIILLPFCIIHSIYFYHISHSPLSRSQFESVVLTISWRMEECIVSY